MDARINTPNPALRHTLAEYLRRAPVLWIVLGIMALHLPFFALPSINQEFVFADGAQYFVDHDRALLDQYFAYQANTLALPWAAALLLKYFPWLHSLAAVRLLSLAGVPFAAYGFMGIDRYLGSRAGPIALAYVLLNPLLWIYASRGTADFLPAALALAAIGMSFARSRSVLAGCVLGCAAVLKPHMLSALLFIFAAIASTEGGIAAARRSSMVGAIACAIFGAYMFEIHRQYGFWLTPPRFQTIHHFEFSDTANNWIAYMGFLMLATAPISLTAAIELRLSFRRWMLGAGAGVAIAALGMATMHEVGEMGLGPLDRFIPWPALAALFTILALLLVVLIMFPGRTKNVAQYRALGFAIMLTLLVFSTSRPAQRYLVLLIPLTLLILPSQSRLRTVTIWAALPAFALINGFVAYSQWCTGTAAMKMVHALEAAHLVEITDPGTIAGDVGNYFRGNDPTTSRFEIVPGVRPNAIIHVDVGLRPIGKAYSLVPRQASAPQ